MRYRQLEFSRTFNQGNYESERVTLTVDLDETEDLDESFRALKAKVFHLHETGKLLEESKKVVEAETSEKPTETQFNAPNWTQKTGTKGVYEQAENDGSENFKVVSQYVKNHSGFCQLHGYKVWLHNSDENLIDRRR